MIKTRIGVSDKCVFRTKTITKIKRQLKASLIKTKQEKKNF